MEPHGDSFTSEKPRKITQEEYEQWQKNMAIICAEMEKRRIITDCINNTKSQKVDEKTKNNKIKMNDIKENAEGRDAAVQCKFNDVEQKGRIRKKRNDIKENAVRDTATQYNFNDVEQKGRIRKKRNDIQENAVRQDTATQYKLNDVEQKGRIRKKRNDIKENAVRRDTATQYNFNDVEPKGRIRKKKNDIKENAVRRNTAARYKFNNIEQKGPIKPKFRDAKVKSKKFVSTKPLKGAPRKKFETRGYGRRNNFNKPRHSMESDNVIAATNIKVTKITSSSLTPPNLLMPTPIITSPRPTHPHQLGFYRELDEVNNKNDEDYYIENGNVNDGNAYQMERNGNNNMIIQPPVPCLDNVSFYTNDEQKLSENGIKSENQSNQNLPTENSSNDKKLSNIEKKLMEYKKIYAARRIKVKTIVTSDYDPSARLLCNIVTPHSAISRPPIPTKSFLTNLPQIFEDGSFKTKEPNSK